MPEGDTRRIRLIFVGCVAVLVVLFDTGLLRTSSANTLRALELQAHEKLVQLIRDGNKLTSFTTDGCSGGLSSTWRVTSDLFPEFAKAHRTSPPWENCCVTHDRAYHAAGGATEAEQSYALRLAADETLKECISRTSPDRSADLQARYGLTDQQVRAAYRIIANAMYEAVRVGGFPCSGLEWRWGYGYPQC